MIHRQVRSDFVRVPYSEAIKNGYLSLRLSLFGSSITKVDYDSYPISSVISATEENIRVYNVDIDIDRLIRADDQFILIPDVLRHLNKDGELNLHIPEISFSEIDLEYNNFSRDVKVADLDDATRKIADELYVSYLLSLDLRDKVKNSSKERKKHGITESAMLTLNKIGKIFPDSFSAKEYAYQLVKKNLFSISFRDMVTTRIIESPVFALHRDNKDIIRCSLEHSGFIYSEGVYYAEYIVTHEKSGYQETIIPFLESSSSSSSFFSGDDHNYFEDEKTATDLSLIYK